MWTVRHTVGKLVEARLTCADGPEVTACLTAVASAVAQAPCPVVGVLDLSQVRVLGRQEADLFVSVMRGNNQRVTRTGILVSSNALLEMQIERLVRAAALPERRVFRAPAPALNWLCQMLSATEAARARAFFDE